MNIGTLTVTLGVDTTQLGTALTKMNTFAQKIRTVGYLTSAVITLPIVAAGKASFKMAKDFEFNIQKMVGLIGIAQSSATEFGDAILKMAPEVAKGPKELSDAMYYIVSAGIRGAEALDVLKVSAMAASAGLGETKDVADLITSALNAYKGTGLTAAKATDILVAAVRVGKIEATGFAAAVGSVIPTASNMGVSLDQVAGAMAAMSLSGAKAAQAATYLKGMFNNLMKGGEIGKGAEALRAVHTSYEELRKILREQGILSMLERMRVAMAQYGDTLVAKVFPNIRAMTAVLSVAGKNWEYNSKIMKEVTNSAGSLGAAWAAVADTIKIKYDRAISSAQVSMVILGKSVAETVLPILNSLVERLNKLVIWFNSLTKAQKRHKIEFLMWVVVLGPASLLVSALIYTMSGLLGIINFVIKGFTILRVVMLANPLLAVIGLVATLAGGYLLLKNRTKDVSDEQSRLNKLWEEADRLRGEKTSIEDRHSMLFTLNQGQLETFKNDINVQKRLQEDALVNWEAYRKNWVDTDQGWISMQKILAVQEVNLKSWKDKKIGELVSSENGQIKLTEEIRRHQINNWEYGYNHQYEIMKEYLKNRESFINAQVESAKKEIKTMEEWSKEVDVAITKITDPIKKAEENLKAFLEQLKQINEFKDELDYLSILEKTMNSLGLTYDATEDKVQTLTEYLKYLVKEGYDPAGKEIQTVVNKLKELNSVLAEQRINDEWAEASAKTWEKKWKAMIPPLGYNTNLKIKTPGQMMGVAPTLPGGGFMPSIPKEDIEEANRQMERAKALASELTKVFTNMFETMGEGWQSVVDSIIQGIKRLVAVVMARLVVFGILSMLSGGTGKLAMSVGKLIKGGFWDFMLEPLGRGLSKGASGGIVPPGFSNDTYPALLSSGEKVIPAGIGHADTIRLEVDTIRVAGKDLAIVLRRAGQYN